MIIQFGAVLRLKVPDPDRNSKHTSHDNKRKYADDERQIAHYISANRFLFRSRLLLLNNMILSELFLQLDCCNNLPKCTTRLNDQRINLARFMLF